MASENGDRDVSEMLLGLQLSVLGLAPGLFFGVRGIAWPFGVLLVVVGTLPFVEGW